MATVGGMISLRRRDTAERARFLWGSFATKLALLVTIFFSVPIILYAQFREGDDQRTRILLDSLQTQGRLIARSLEPMLQSFDGNSARVLSEVLVRLGAGEILKIKVLLRPAGQPEPTGFFYVASQPVVPNEYLDQERVELVDTGILRVLQNSCEGNQTRAWRYINPAGQEEILTSIIPVNTEAGCWAVITSHASDEWLGASIDLPYWQTPQVRVAAAIYILMALIVLSLFLGIWRSLVRFGRLARDIRTGGPGDRSFAALNSLPELSAVAQEFDSMVESLDASALSIRRAAEENAHAFKTPIAIISQSLEPLRRSINGDDKRTVRAIELIERAIGRLDALVSAARQMDEMSAELIDPPRERTELSTLVEAMLDAYAESFDAKHLRVVRLIEPSIYVMVGSDLLETVMENLLDNAIDFSPLGGELTIGLARQRKMVTLIVADRGPGVDPNDLDRIFERYYSFRTAKETGEHIGEGENFGIGLWLVRRNIEAVGGNVRAENRPEGGLAISLAFPLPN